MTPHADAARDKLRDDAQRDYGSVRVSAQHFGQQIANLRASTDLTDTMRAAANAILSAEALAHAATLMGEGARRALATAMADTGCTSLDLGSHRVVLTAKAASAVITDKDAVPARFWVQPPPRLDLSGLGKALRSGEQIAGAVLGNAGEQTLSIRGAS